MGLVYRIWNEERRSVYIGSTVNWATRRKTHRRDLNAGKHDNQRLQRAWAKYGAEAFVFEVLADGIADGVLCEEEDRQILAAREGGLLVYNIRLVAASNLGFRMSDEQRHAMSVSRKGKPGKKGVRLSDETRAKISRKAKGREISQDTRDKIAAANLGSKRSPETRAKMSQANRGRVKTEAQRMALAKAMKGRPGPNLGRVFGQDVRSKVSAARIGKPSYVRTAEISAKQSDAGKKRWARLRESGMVPDRDPKPCCVCSRPSKPLRRGRCHSCNEYFRRHGIDRDVESSVASTTPGRSAMAATAS